MNFESLARSPMTHTPYNGKTDDGLGNTVITYGDPVEVKVYTISPHVVEEGTATSTQTEVADLDVSMPKRAVNLKDRFSDDDGTYEVVGVRDRTKGFHGWQPGIIVELQKVT